MRYAVPLAEGRLTTHFGHCAAFALVETQDGEITGQEEVPAPEHVPGLLPKWLHEQGVNAVIAGGMGQRAQQLFAAAGIEVVVGAPSLTAQELVEQHLKGELTSGPNACNH